MQQRKHLEELERILADQIAYVEVELSKVSENRNTEFREGGSWSIKELVEHLNTYMRYYLPLIDDALSEADQIDSLHLNYNAGIIPRYMIAQIKPDKKKKLKARSMHIPHVQKKSFGEVLNDFKAHMRHLEQALSLAKGVDINKHKLPVSFMKALKFPLGAVLEFLILHNERHMMQMKVLHASE